MPHTLPPNNVCGNRTKKGRHSVGVARQYCGQLGKQDNCQVAVTLSLANRTASLPVAYRLYLPQEWADDPARRQKAGVPESLFECAISRIYADSAVSALSLEQALACKTGRSLLA